MFSGEGGLDQPDESSIILNQALINQESKVNTETAGEVFDLLRDKTDQDISDLFVTN